MSKHHWLEVDGYKVYDDNGNQKVRCTFFDENHGRCINEAIKRIEDNTFSGPIRIGYMCNGNHNFLEE